MSAKGPRPSRLSILVTALVLAVAGGQVALPGRSISQAAEARFAKYYIVDESGADETLVTIAVRIFGDDSRAGELYGLNVNRVQPDGGVLKDASELRTGWFLVLPWDAVGEEVRYGQLPEREGVLPSPLAPPSVDPATGASPPGATGGGTADQGSSVPRGLWIVLTVAVLSLVAGTGLWWWRRSAKGVAGTGAGRP